MYGTWKPPGNPTTSMQIAVFSGIRFSRTLGVRKRRSAHAPQIGLDNESPKVSIDRLKLAGRLRSPKGLSIGIGKRTGNVYSPKVIQPLPGLSRFFQLSVGCAKSACLRLLTCVPFGDRCLGTKGPGSAGTGSDTSRGGAPVEDSVENRSKGCGKEEQKSAAPLPGG